MNLSKPTHITLTGSFLLGLFVFATLLVVNTVETVCFSPITLFIIPLVTAILSFIVFSFLVKRFINKKIQVIYGIISNRQISEKPAYGFSDDILTELTKETAEWAEVQNQQIEQLKSQAAFRKEFLGNLAHELKTPAFSIQGYILTLLEGGLEDERVNRDFLERALSGVDRISNLLEDLDEIAKFETDRFNLKLVRFDIIELLKRIFQELETKAKRKSITLKLDKNYEPIYVIADKNKITQVFVNLILNSIAYGIDGGKTSIDIQNFDKHTLMVNVVDNGLGMAQTHINRLFERFYRVEKSRERNSGGSGLGLSIVKHIIEAHQQTINVRSTEGVGSTFYFTLEKA